MSKIYHACKLFGSVLRLTVIYRIFTHRRIKSHADVRRNIRNRRICFFVRKLYSKLGFSILLTDDDAKRYLQRLFASQMVADGYRYSCLCYFGRVLYLFWLGNLFNGGRWRNFQPWCEQLFGNAERGLCENTD